MESIRRYNVERSCLRCHERKVKCDKNSPCNRCVNLGETCQYPGPRKGKRRAPKTSVTDVVSRLEQLERSIATLAGSSSTSQTRSQQQLPLPRAAPLSVPTSASIHDHIHTPNNRSPGESNRSHGVLVRDGAYIDEPFLSRVLEKEQELQSAIGTPSTETSDPRKPPPLKVDGIITNPLLTQMDFKSLYPGRYQATLLWQTFLARVEPVIKVLHIPTTQPRIFAAISRPDSARPEVHCLLFSILFSATTALLSDDPTNEQIRMDLRRYQQGMELSIYNSSFLDSPTLSSIQAMTIYLTCLRYSNSGRAGFTLRGLAIRAAQSIGLHRDGENFKLSPLECELRRRVWWSLFCTDARMAEDHGILAAEHEYNGDTKFPSNIDDQNISETSTEPVQSKQYWTEMSFNLIITEVHKMWVPMTRSVNTSSDKDQPSQILKEMKERLHTRFIQYAHTDIPIQRHGAILVQVLTSKAEVHIYQKALQKQGTDCSAIDPNAATELLSLALKALDLGLELYTDELLRGFRWLTSTYSQLHLLTYILWYLCVYPNSSYSEHAWHSVNRHFDLVDNDPSWPDPGPKWPMLKQLRAKALRVRHSQIISGSGSGSAESLADGDYAGQVEMNDSARDELLDMYNWDLNWLEFPDWNFLAQSSIMGQYGTGQS